MLRDLAVEFAHQRDGESRAWLTVTEHLCTPQGHLRAGIVATVVDAIGGGLAAMAAAPNWMATADLTLHLTRPIAAPSVLEAAARVLRAGRTTIVIESELALDHGAGARVGYATMTFSVLPRRDTNPTVRPDDGSGDGAPPRQVLGGTGGALDRDIYEMFGFRATAPGIVEVDPAPYIENSLGAVNGGVLASLVDAAAAGALPDGHETADLQLFYLALAKQGPIRATADAIRRGDGFGTTTIAVDDSGASRRTTVATATAVRW
jgi:uncharacterized protein (TIGR00369 family)